jgi:hypothetical protein
MTTVAIGIVKSSQVDGDISSTIVAKALVISEYKRATSSERCTCVTGFVTPKKVNEMKQRINPLAKKAIDPSKDRVVFNQGRLIFLLPYFLPITDAKVSEIIINKIPAIGKYI